jgi:hypothetical protein
MSKRAFQLGSLFTLVGALAAANLIAEEGARSPRDDAQHFRAKQILGSKVTLEGDSSAGTVDDIVIDEHGNVDYLIVVNSENRLVTVPWDAARFNPEKRMAVVHIAPEKFRQAPTYTVTQYPNFATPAYRTEIYRWYGLTPGQERRAIRRGAVVVP